MKVLSSKEETTLTGIPYLHDCLVYDIETDSLDTTNAKVKFVSAYSFRDKRYYCIPRDKLAYFERLLKDHRVIIGFNNKDFDNLILQNEHNKISLQYKVVVDCLKVLYDHKRNKPVREQIIILPDGSTMGESLSDHKLSTIAKLLNFEYKKGEIEYKIFQKDEWTDDEYNEINDYLFRDIMVTKSLFEFLCNYFRVFIEDMSPDDIKKFNWLRTSGGSYCYKIVCHKCGLKEEYDDSPPDTQDRPGGFVKEPTASYFEDVMYCDGKSAYAHIMMMFNLFKPGTWHGNDMFQVKGYYDDKEMGPVSNFIRDNYNERLRLKKLKDPREITKKLVGNLFFGCSGKKVFKSLYNFDRSYDIMWLGRQIITKLAERMESAGFEVIYSDTDSVLVQSHGKHDEVKKVLADYKKEVDSHVPFPQETFTFNIQDMVKKIWFFEDKNNPGKFKKKTYIYINEKGDVKCVGGVIKKIDATKLGKLIFDKYIKPSIPEHGVKFPRETISKWIQEELSKDISLVSRVFNVREVETYANNTSVQAQISKAFGPGGHELVPNHRLGIGKGKRYCSMEDAKKLSINDIDLDKTWSELEMYIDDAERFIITLNKQSLLESYQS